MSASLISTTVKTPGAIAGGGAPVFAIRPGASGSNKPRPRIKRVTFVVNGNVANTVVDVYRIDGTLSSSIGTPSTSQLGQPYAYQDAAAITTNVDTVWSAAPAIGTLSPIDGVSINGVIGQGAVLVFPEPGIVLELGQILLGWAPVAGAQLRITPVWEE